MTIVKAKKPDAPKSIDSFIQAAPDAVKGPGVRKGNKVQISLTIDPELLQLVDEYAAEQSMGRAGLINLAIRNMLENGVSLGRPKA